MFEFKTQAMGAAAIAAMVLSVMTVSTAQARDVLYRMGGTIIVERGVKQVQVNRRIVVHPGDRIFVHRASHGKLRFADGTVATLVSGHADVFKVCRRNEKRGYCVYKGR